MRKRTLIRLGASARAGFCPNCGSQQVHRSRRKNIAEKTILRLLAISPYRCARCDERYLTLGASRTEAPAQHEQIEASTLEAVEQPKTREKSRARSARA